MQLTEQNTHIRLQLEDVSLVCRLPAVVENSFTVSWCHGVSLPLILAPIYSYAFILLLCYVPRGHCIVYSLVYRHCGMCRRQPGFLVLLSVDCVLCIQVTVQHGQNGGRTKEFQVSCLYATRTRSVGRLCII